ncbi:MAG: LCP family protein [Streptosporangiales bacterium]|nr:LCP family protein [Streptosporangiales bacterium]
MGTRSARRRRRRGRGRDTWAAVGLAALSVLIPGAGHIWAGRKAIGAFILVCFLALLGVAAFVGTTTDRAELMSYLVDSNVLTAVIVCALLLAVGWSAVIVSAYYVRSPGRPSPFHATLAAIVIGVLSLAVSTPPIYAARYAYVGRDVLNNVFSSDHDQKRKTKEGKDPWAGKPRINVLLLGGDGGSDRTGIRTDSMTVASIDTHTGNTVLFGLPRNMQHAPMPPRLRSQFPNGYTDLLNAVYEYGAQNPDSFHGKRPGIQALQEVIEQILGIGIDYYVLVNLQAFVDIVNAIGGVDLYVEKDIPIGGEGHPITGWIRKGDRHLNGQQALWYGRSRAVDDDYHRMARQKCVLAAIAKQADPPTVLRGFQKIAASTKKNVFTDIPSADLPALTQLGEKAKTAQISSVNFVPPAYDTVNPDYAKIARVTQQTIAKTEKKPTPGPSATASSTGGTGKPKAKAKEKAKRTTFESTCRLG